jgi:hypothetical protein
MRPTLDTAMLRRHSPAQLRVVDADGIHLVNVGDNRKRWSAALSTVQAYSWERVEMLDDSGGLLGAVSAREETPGVSGAQSPESEVAGILAVVQRATEAALKAHVDSQANMLRALVQLAEAQGRGQAEQARLVGTLAGLVGELATVAAHQTIAAAELAAEASAEAADAAESETTMDRLLELAGTVATALADGAKPNGAS